MPHIIECRLEDVTSSAWDTYSLPTVWTGKLGYMYISTPCSKINRHVAVSARHHALMLQAHKLAKPLRDRPNKQTGSGPHLTHKHTPYQLKTRIDE